jgi:hypothetical protein
MIPKVDSCIHAVRNGVHNAHILDGRIAHVLLLEIFTDAGIGTMISAVPSTAPQRRARRKATHERPHLRHRRGRPLPVHARVRRAGGEFVERVTAPRSGTRRDALPRLPVGHRRRLARPRQPRDRRRDLPQASTLLHVSNFFTNPQATGRP